MGSGMLTSSSTFASPGVLKVIAFIVAGIEVMAGGEAARLVVALMALMARWLSTLPPA